MAPQTDSRSLSEDTLVSPSDHDARSEKQESLIRSSRPCHEWPDGQTSPDVRGRNINSPTLYAPECHCKLSSARLFVAHAGAAMTLFLATTDATIVSTILPTIMNQLGASSAQYTWVSVTYMLTQTAFQPLYGKVSDLVGRMRVLFTSILIFAIGNALSGAAQTIVWLIVARAIAGIGAGGIVSLVWTITAEIVEIQSQAKWSQALSVTWACSAIAGPLLGGVFSEETGILSWRWAFYLNLPICAVSSIILWCALGTIDLERSNSATWKLFWKTFDFLGLFLFMAASSCIIIGLNISAEQGWTAPATLCSIGLGLVIFVCGGVYENRTQRDALFPPVVFTDLTIVFMFIVIFLHNFAFNAGTFYLALFFQAADGLSPLQAGIRMLPYSLGSSLASMPAAWFINYCQTRLPDLAAQKITTSVGLAISTLGFGLMTRLDNSTGAVERTAYIMLAGIGIGFLFHAPYQIFIRALRRKDTASGTSAFFMVRFTGATVGLTLAGAIFDGRLAQTLPPGLHASTILRLVRQLQLANLKSETAHALSVSIQSIWMVCCPCLGVALLLSLALGKWSGGANGSNCQGRAGGCLPKPKMVTKSNEVAI